MDAWMDGRTDGWRDAIDGWMDGRMDGLVDGCTWMDGRTDGWMGGWMPWMDGWMDAWTDGRTDGWVDAMDGWMDGWMDGCICVWMYGFMAVWMDTGKMDGATRKDGTFAFGPWQMYMDCRRESMLRGYGRISDMAVAQKTGTKMGCPGKWKHGPKPAVCPSYLILSHTHMGTNRETKKETKRT